MNHNPLMLRYRPSFATAFSTSSRVVLPAASLLVWGAVAFSAVTWGLRWSATGESTSNATAAAQALPEVDVSAAARSLGAAPVQAAAAPTLASRFQLQGVMAGGPDAGAALIAVDNRELRTTRFGNEPRSIFCGIGVCYDCVVVVNGVANQRSCLIEATDEMNVESTS